MITNRYYYGMHSTDNLNDGYKGSGKILWHSINKYGIDNHKIEIVEQFDTREQMVKKETDFVNSDLLKDALCMNLKQGGEGGGRFWNEEHRKKCCHAGALKSLEIRRNRHSEKLKNDQEYREKYCKSLSKSLSGEKNPFYGKHHSEETKEKMRKPHKTYKKRKSKMTS